MKRILLLGVAFAATIGVIAHAQSPGTGSLFPLTWTMPYASIQRTYALQATNLSPTGSNASDIVQLCGNAAVVTKLQRITVSGRATAVAAVDMLVVKRSTFDLGGTPVSTSPFSATGAADHSAAWTWSLVGVPYDASDSASVATVTPYTSVPQSGLTVNNNNWTAGTTVGILANAQYFMGNLTTGINGQPPLVFDFGNRPAKPVYLRTASQCVALAISPAGLAGNVVEATVEWTEE